MSAREIVRCDRCRQSARSGKAARDGWNAVTSAGVVTGYICNGCQTVEENMAAEINMATVDYGRTPDGRLTGRPKGSVTVTPEPAGSRPDQGIELGQEHPEHGALLSTDAVALLFGVDRDTVAQFAETTTGNDLPDEWVENGVRRREIAEAAMQQDGIGMMDSLVFWASVDHGMDVVRDRDGKLWMVEAV